MPARPQDSLSQRRLVYELRITVDKARSAHSEQAHTKAVDEVIALIRENPTSTQASYVTHNIGRARREWLAPLVREHATGARAKSSRSKPTR